MRIRLCVHTRIRLCVRTRMRTTTVHHQTTDVLYFVALRPFFQCWISLPRPSSNTIVLSFHLFRVGIFASSHNKERKLRAIPLHNAHYRRCLVYPVQVSPVYVQCQHILLGISLATCFRGAVHVLVCAREIFPRFDTKVSNMTQVDTARCSGANLSVFEGQAHVADGAASCCILFVLEMTK